MFLTVEYKENLPISDVVNEIQSIHSPHIFLWYIGTNGLKKACAHFYRDFLINPIYETNKNAIFWLVDLCAWGALREPQKLKISQKSSLTKKIDGLADGTIRCINSSSIFKRMQAIRDPHLVNYFQKALHKEFIRNQSKLVPPKNVSIGTLLKHNCPLIASLYEMDVSQAYSYLQYLEGCLLIEHVLLQTHEPSEDITLIFALPNDEAKYYQDRTHAFEKNTKFFLETTHPHFFANAKIHIKFLSFDYGAEKQHRPYNAPGPVFKLNQFSSEEVINLALTNARDTHALADTRP